MLEREDLPSSEQSASVIDQVVVIGLEHIDLYGSKIEFLEPDQTLIGFVKDPALTGLYDIPLAPVLLLALLISKMVCLADLGIVIHILGPQLDFRIASRLLIVKPYMHRAVSRGPRSPYIIPVVGPDTFAQDFRYALITVSRQFRRKSTLLKESGKCFRDLIKITDLL